VVRVPNGGLLLGRFSPFLFATLFIVALIADASCSNLGLKRDLILRQPDGSVIEKVTGFSAPETPPMRSNFSADDIAKSLRRIVVKYHGLISFSLSDPVPLLTTEQSKAYASVLAAELPTLAPNQRIRFSFKDARKHNLNEMDVYAEGAYVVFYFNVLVGNPALALNAGDPPFSEADISQLPGQKVSYALPAAIILKDPVSGSSEAAAADTAGARALIEENRANGMISAEEAERLRGVVEKHPQVRAEAWRDYWEKRATLKKAREQGLLDDGAYNTRLAKIEQDLAP